MNNLIDVQSEINNAITELERDHGSNYFQDLEQQIHFALDDLYKARKYLQEIIDCG